MFLVDSLWNLLEGEREPLLVLCAMMLLPSCRKPSQDALRTVSISTFIRLDTDVDNELLIELIRGYFVSTAVKLKFAEPRRTTIDTLVSILERTIDSIISTYFHNSQQELLSTYLPLQMWSHYSSMKPSRSAAVAHIIYLLFATNEVLWSSPRRNLRNARWHLLQHEIA